MTDSDRISVLCDIVIDYVEQVRKNSRPRKGVRLVLDRDEWGNIILVVLSKSNKMKFKLENNMIQVYTDNKSKGKASVELELPHVILQLSDPPSISDFQAFLDIVQKLYDDPASADGLELFKGEEDDYAPSMKKGKRKASEALEDE